MSLQQLQVGPIAAADGSNPTMRGSRDGCGVIQHGHAKFQEAVYRGNCYAVADQTAKTMPAGLSTAPTTVTLFNPKGNNKLAVIWFGGVVTLVATTAAAAIWVAANNNIAAAAVTGTAGVPANCLIGNGNTPSILTFTAATLPAAPVAIDVLGAFLTGAITVDTQVAALGKWYDGALIIAPGGALSFQASTASAAGAFGSWIWEEIPI